ncbi:MAG: glutamate racemase [Bacilli bacterium]|nr:glutamate racemase [Bacilli bacterium]
MIGIFDSGIGGVTVFKEILKSLPNYQYLYYSDSINNPYGDKNNEELISITREIVKYLIKRGAKIIVIACNTASAICRDDLRKEFDIPIIAIEPAIKLAYDLSYDKKTLVLATKGTLESKKFRELYQKYNNYNMTICECVGLADLIEKNEEDKINEYLINNIKKFRGVNNVVLGCTHYPIIKDKIKSALGQVDFYDGSLGVVKQLKKVIIANNLEETKLDIKFIDSSNSKIKEDRFYEILKED